MLLFWGARSIDPDALAWAAAVTANSGTYSQSTLAAVSNFAKSAKSAGYWSKLNRINLFCGDQLAAAMVPLKAGGGSSTETNVNFVSGDYSEATGLTGNGTTKYLRTGLVASVSLSANDTHLSIYNRTNAVPGVSTLHIGVRVAPDFFEILAPQSDGIFYSRAYDDATGRVSSAVLTGPFGHMVASRTAANSHAVYRNGSSLASNATSGGAFPAGEVYVFASNSGGAATGYSAQAYGGYSIGAGLTAADVTAFSAHMEAFQDALGRGVA